LDDINVQGCACDIVLTYCRTIFIVAVLERWLIYDWIQFCVFNTNLCTIYISQRLRVRTTCPRWSC